MQPRCANFYLALWSNEIYIIPSCYFIYGHLTDAMHRWNAQYTHMHGDNCQ